MWSRAARAASLARESANARRAASERSNLVASTSDGDDRSFASAHDRRDRRPEDDGVGGRFGAVVDAVAAPRRENDDERRRNVRHLIPGGLALVACAMVLYAGSYFVEHPIWKFEHVSRWAARRAASVGAAGPMRCSKDPALTGEQTCLPSFAVIGSHVGGMRRLKRLMSQHDMLTTGQKTMHFFNPVYGATQGVQMCEPPELLLKAYFSAVQAGHGETWSPYDPSETMKAKRDGEAFERELGDVVTGDWSDTYFNCACCASTMKRLMPNLRPIVVLRDPVGRAMARYVEENHPHGTPVEASGLSACALKENGYTWGATAKKTKEYLEQCVKEADGADSGTLTRECLDFHSVLGWSMYAEYLEVWLEEFPNLLVIYTDDIEENPTEVAKEVETYLGLPPSLTPYEIAGLGALEDTDLASIAFDLQPQLAKTSEDKEATEELLAFFEPHVKRLDVMAQKGKIPPLPYKWKRRYNIPVRHSVKSRKLLADDESAAFDGNDIDGLISSLTQVDDRLDDVKQEHTDETGVEGGVDIEEVLGVMGQTETKSTASGQYEDGDANLMSEYDDDSGKESSSSNSTAAIGSGNSTSTSDVDVINSKSKLLQERAEKSEKHNKPSWKASSVRGRFYSDLYVPMDDTVRDELKGQLFVPIAVPYLFQFANEFKHNKAWMDIVGIKKEEQERVYSELWRDDCTHSQQWSARSGCCGLSCCLIGGHRKDTVGLRG